MRTPNWPSRAEWAKQQRTPYYDRFPEISLSISDYATPAEIETLKRELRDLWKRLGRAMKSAKPDAREKLQDQRRDINHTIRVIERGDLPLCREDRFGSQETLASFIARYEHHKAEVHARVVAEIAQTPIDDAAWQKELKRRARIERYREENLAMLAEARAQR